MQTKEKSMSRRKVSENYLGVGVMPDCTTHCQFESSFQKRKCIAKLQNIFSKEAWTLKAQEIKNIIKVVTGHQGRSEGTFVGGVS